jgi:hypothetical protein
MNSQYILSGVKLFVRLKRNVSEIQLPLYVKSIESSKIKKCGKLGRAIITLLVEFRVSIKVVFKLHKEFKEFGFAISKSFVLVGEIDPKEF